MFQLQLIASLSSDSVVIIASFSSADNDVDTPSSLAISSLSATSPPSSPVSDFSSNGFCSWRLDRNRCCCVPGNADGYEGGPRKAVLNASDLESRNL